MCMKWGCLKQKNDYTKTWYECVVQKIIFTSSLSIENNHNNNTNSKCTHTHKTYTKIYHHSTFSDPPFNFKYSKGKRKTIFCTKACLWQKFEKTELWLRPEVMLLQQQIKVKEKWYEF